MICKYVGIVVDKSADNARSSFLEKNIGKYDNVEGIREYQDKCKFYMDENDKWQPYEGSSWIDKFE